MEYLSGVHGLNIVCSLNTSGDWHSSALRWEDLDLRESNDSLLGNWGIEVNKKIPNHTGRYSVANHLRSILDLMISNKLPFLKGFRNDFICTDEYNQEFFEQVIKLKSLDNWCEINSLMKREFMWEWDRFMEKQL